MVNDRKVMKQSATGLSLPLNKMDMQGDVSMADFISEDNIQSQQKNYQPGASNSKHGRSLRDSAAAKQVQHIGNATNQGDNRSGGASNSLTAKNPRSGATNKPNVKGVEQSHKSGSGSSLKNIRRQSTAESQAIQNSQPY